MSLPNYFTSLFTRIMPDLVQEIAVLKFKICPDCEVCSFTIHLALQSPQPQTLSLQSHGLIFHLNPSLEAGKYIFYDVISNFRLTLVFFCQKVPETWRSNNPIQK